MAAMTRSPARSEPLFNAPAAPLALVGSIVGFYFVQSRLLDDAAVVSALGLIPRAVGAGQGWRLLSVLLVHGGWAHALLNALGALAFGTPVARWLGRGGRGAAIFFAFYLACGLLASLGFYLLHPDSAGVLVGASGAISGLMGASSRMIDRPGRLSSFASRTVVAMAASWGFINLLMAMRWVDLGTGGAPIAWEAHLFGYGAGLLLIGPTTRVAGWRRP
jgi:membrane associated rhomboid family serine protease